MWFSGRDFNENSLDFFAAQLQKVFYYFSLMKQDLVIFA